MTVKNIKTYFVHEEYRGYEILEFVKPYEGTNQKLSFSADVKLSEPGELFFYTPGKYYINGCRRKVYKINDTEWHRVKIEGTTEGIIQMNQTAKDVCFLFIVHTGQE